MPHSVLSHLTLRFAPHPENIATEALCYLLTTSESCRGGLARALSRFGFRQRVSEFQSQANSDSGARPDIVGRAPDGSTCLLLEAKFWAGLTAHQPVTYLREMLAAGAETPQNGELAGSAQYLLLFIAPAHRLTTLCAELQHRVTDAGLGSKTVAADGGPFLMRFGHTAMGVCSWRDILHELREACTIGQDRALHDIAQIEALCEYMDEEAFLPLRSEELNPDTGRRILQFGGLVDEVQVGLCAAGGIAGIQPGGGNGHYSRFLSYGGWRILVQFSAENWKSRGESPLWIGFRDQADADAAGRILRLAGLNPMLRFGHWLLPLRVRTGMEREGVLRDLIAQAKGYLQVLGTSSSGRVGADADSTAGSK